MHKPEVHSRDDPHLIAEGALPLLPLLELINLAYFTAFYTMLFYFALSHTALSEKWKGGRVGARSERESGRE